MNTTNLQIPIRRDLKIAATEVALEQGFSSLQEAVRVFINKMAQKTIDVVFIPKTIKLSQKAVKRYNKITEDIEKGIGIYEVHDVDDLMRQLNS
ncbi:hypothetical protein COS77_01020 [Candidatus Roizmanbacteria bacterium CG06_land_8_20_14_3_00_34_14]|uniref:Type II toxin-antitoxin system antitoxin, RelB/DinJ family n=2 Tax=Candidatus Roizmaniibacteriota TaxID=1752723 RepID=A0A2M7AVA4_9BACT|nr:MAG: hypothetical protein COT02_05070 [Candidatus Roizmanbacteria bacterium CG07_land_8_20_14_0_80_34_15]PIU74542.1 MAG: hypothetical protein COS77_01020 [Candidatus Roizmanbacteria bacterium CG06_land_8_20_14_3_00_34_14]